MSTENNNGQTTDSIKLTLKAHQSTDSKGQSITNKGSLVCVGLGITLGAHLTPIARSHIEQADIVFTSGNSGFMHAWLLQLNENVHDLQSLYQLGKSRGLTYQQMVDSMLEHVRLGKRVVGAFYGHPGMFVTPTHRAIEQAKSEGFFAKMEAGISAEDCLIADCGIDPGRMGCSHFEANQFINFHRKVDTSGYLILWQVGVLGDSSLTQFTSGPEYQALLVEVLLQYYPKHHPITLYEAANVAISQTRIEVIELKDFVGATVNQCTTMLIPPFSQLKANIEIQNKLAVLQKKRQSPKLALV